MVLEVRIVVTCMGGWQWLGGERGGSWGAVDILFLDQSSGYTGIFSFSKSIEWYTYGSAVSLCIFQLKVQTISSLPSSDSWQNSIPWSFYFEGWTFLCWYIGLWIPSSGIFYFRVSWECFTWQKKPLFRKGRRALTFPGHWLYVLTLTTAFQGRCHPPCFIGKEAGAQSSKVICPRSWNCLTAEFYLPQYPLSCSCDRDWANHAKGMSSIPATAQWGSYIAILFYRWEHWGSESLDNLLSSPH